MDETVTPEQQVALQALGVTASEYIFYQARRIDGRYLTHAMAALLVYDFLLTLGDEVEFIWKTKPTFSVAKALWFLNRYWPLISVCVRIWAMAYAVPSDLVCNVAIQFTAWSSLVNIAIVDILLMLRVWALYNGSRRVKWFLIAVFVIGLPTAIGIRQAPPIAGIPLVTPASRSLTVCKRSPPTELFSLFTMALVIDTIIFAMVIYRAGGRQFRSQTPMLAVLVRDGALYYAAITAVLAFMIAATFIPIFYQPVADANLNVPLSSLACNRLILSLRGVYFRGADGDTRTDVPTITTSYHANNRPPQFARTGNDIHLGAMPSPTTPRDIRLAALRSPKRRSDIQIRSVDSDWDGEMYKTSPEIESVLSHGSAGGHSRGRSLMNAFPRRHSPPKGSVVPIIGQVTVSVTKSAVADDGAEVRVPSEEEVRVASPDLERSRGIDRWDSRESVSSNAQTAGAGSNFSRPGVYESRVGYFRDRIQEEMEGQHAAPQSPGSSRSGA